MSTNLLLRSEVVIDEKRCHGCGYCVQFCPRGCLKISGDKVGPRGYTLPVLVNPEQCNTCGFCVRMCPHWAIQVHLCGKVNGEDVFKERVAGPPRLAPMPPLADCSGCQHPTVGRIIAEVLDELGLDGKYITLDGITCSDSTAFGVADSSQLLDPYEDVIEMASVTKRMHPDKTVVAVQNNTKFDITGLSSLVAASTRGDNITIINCTDPVCGPWRIEQYASIPVVPREQGLTTGKYPLHIAEMVATFAGVAYSARGAITSPDDYQLSKSYVRTALQKQIDDFGFSIVDILCLCFAESPASYAPYANPVDGLQWAKDRMLADFPLGEFKVVSEIEQQRGYYGQRENRR